jgi:MFS family permease
MLALYLTRERGFTVAQAGWTVALHGAGAVLAAPLGGTLSDRVGRRATLMIGLWLGAAAMLLLGWAHTPTQVVGAVLLLGCLGEFYRPAIFAAVADVVPSGDRARAYGLMYWAANLGFSVALPLAGWMSSRGFLWLFVADAFTTFFYGVVVWLRVPETRPTTPPEERSAGGASRLSSLVPFQDGVFRAFALPVFLVAVCFFQGNASLALDLTKRGLTPAQFGWVMSLNGVLIVLLQPVAGRWVGQLRRAVALAWAAGLTGLGYGLHALPAEMSLAMLAVAVWTMGEIAHAASAPTVVADLAPSHLRGSYQGAYHMLWAAAACAGPAVGGWVLERWGHPALWGSCLAVGLFAAGWHLAVGAQRRRHLQALRLQRSEVSAALD